MSDVGQSEARRKPGERLGNVLAALIQLWVGMAIAVIASPVHWWSFLAVGAGWLLGCGVINLIYEAGRRHG